MHACKCECVSERGIRWDFGIGLKQRRILADLGNIVTETLNFYPPDPRHGAGSRLCFSAGEYWNKCRDKIAPDRHFFTQEGNPWDRVCEGERENGGQHVSSWR